MVKYCITIVNYHFPHIIVDTTNKLCENYDDSIFKHICVCKIADFMETEGNLEPQRETHSCDRNNHFHVENLIISVMIFYVRSILT